MELSDRCAKLLALTSHECALLARLDHHPARISSLVSKSNLPRTSVYRALQTLVARGIVRSATLEKEQTRLHRTYYRVPRFMIERLQQW